MKTSGLKLCYKKQHGQTNTVQYPEVYVSEISEAIFFFKLPLQKRGFWSFCAQFQLDPFGICFAILIPENESLRLRLRVCILKTTPHATTSGTPLLKDFKTVHM
jgi:hypothetical protein